jgi:hypothetical protein
MTTETVTDNDGNVVDVTDYSGKAEAEAKRKLALLKAVGLDRVPVEQRELALAIAKRYDLDLLLKHLVLIEGRPYVTRDALLWIAHRSGQFDGIEVSKPITEGDYWYAEATVYRKDMSHPFVYGGRYPLKGSNARFGPEMAVKVAESMALRRAFNVSAPTQDERWDMDVPTAEPEKPKSLAERAAEKVQIIHADEPAATDAVMRDAQGGEAPAVEADQPIPESAPEFVDGQFRPAQREDAAVRSVTNSEPTGTRMVQCENKSPFSDELCRKESGHRGAHRASATETW